MPTTRRPGFQRRTSLSPRTLPRGLAIFLRVVVTLVVVILLVQLIGSPIATSFANRKLSRLPNYTGRVENVQIELWRLGVHIRDLALFERRHESETPIVHVKDAIASFALTALLRGKLGGDMTVDELVVEIVKRTPSAEKSDGQKSAEKEDAKAEVQQKAQQVERWQDTFRNSFPMTLTKLEIKNSRIHFIDRTQQPVPEFTVDRIHVVAEDLQNRPKADGDPLPAHVRMNAVTTGNGKVQSTARVDPTSDKPRFALTFELRDMSLPPLNNFLLAYANADVSRGSFEVYSEINAEGGHYDGYLKPLFHDLDFRTASDRKKSPGELLAKKAVAAVASIFKNKDEQQVATKAPFAGNFADNKVDVWSTIATLFRNAFVQALRGGFEGQTPRR